MTLAALVPAVGDGRGQQARQRKLFQLLDGLPVLTHALDRLEQCPKIDHIYPIVAPDDLSYVQEHILIPGRYQKVADVLVGGLLRQDYITRALVQLGPRYDLVMIHDGSRPLVSQELLLKVIEAGEVHGAAVASVPMHDTLKTISREYFITSSFERRRLRAIQTPQVFRYDILNRAHLQASRENFYGSDEAQLIERIGERIRVVTGSHLNIYVATREDLVLAHALLRSEREIKAIGNTGSGGSDGGSRHEREKERGNS